MRRRSTSLPPPFFRRSHPVAGELQALAVPASFQASKPSDLLRATSAPPSTPALMIKRPLKRSGDVAESQPVVPLPTLRDQSCLPAKSKRNTPDLPPTTRIFRSGWRGDSPGNTTLFVSVKPVRTCPLEPNVASLESLRARIPRPVARGVSSRLAPRRHRTAARQSTSGSHQDIIEPDLRSAVAVLSRWSCRP